MALPPYISNHIEIFSLIFFMGIFSITILYKFKLIKYQIKTDKNWNTIYEFLINSWKERIATYNERKKQTRLPWW